MRPQRLRTSQLRASPPARILTARSHLIPGSPGRRVCPGELTYSWLAREAIVVLTVALTACGGPGSDAASIGTVPDVFGGGAETSVATTPTAPATTAGAGARPTSTARATTTTALAPAAQPVGPLTALPPVQAPFRGDPNSPYCLLARSNKAAPKPLLNNKNALKQQFRQADSDARAAAVLAPDPIKNDVALLANSISALVAALEKADYELARVPSDAMSAISSPASREASTRISTYVADVCGVR